MKKIIALLILITSHQALINAQGIITAMEHWRNIPSYYGPSAMVNDGNIIWVGTSYGAFHYDPIEGEYTHHSKVTGMSDVSISKMAIDPTTGFVIAAYDNANIDIYKNGKWYNLPDIKIANVLGEKRINNIQAVDGRAYLSTHLGLIIVDMTKNQISSTIPFYDGATKGVNFSSIIIGNKIYTATSVGMFSTDINRTDIQNYATWNKLSNAAYTGLVHSGDNIFVLKESNVIDSIFLYNNGTLSYIYSDNEIAFIQSDNKGNVWIGKNYDGAIGYIKLIDKNSNTIQNFNSYQPRAVTLHANGNIYFIDDDKTSKYGGLKKKISNTESENLTPPGPESNFSSDVWVNNNNLWIAHGGANLLYGPTGNVSFVSSYTGNQWKSYKEQFDQIGFLQDALVITRDAVSKNMIVGHTVSGLSQITPDGGVTNEKAPNIEYVNGDINSYKVMGLAQDSKGNLWISNYWAENELKVRTKDGTWYKYHAPNNTSRMAGRIIIDNYNTKWYLAPNGGGVVGYNDNGTLDNPLDDESRVLRNGKGNGNLPSTQTRSIAMDLDGSIWIGTSDGIAIIERPQDVLKGTEDAEIKIVKFEGFNFASPLFQGNEVTSIAVDGANRKWIGTASSGIFLISEDLKKQIFRFTAENSPLPSNNIQNIAIDHATGNVYFSTDRGLALFRSNATMPHSEFASPLNIFPNPVPSNYEGSITIQGLTERSDIRITDAVGQLVYQGVSNGGTFVWNGRDYTGRKVQTGVYLIFAIDKMGKESSVGKFIVQE